MIITVLNGTDSRYGAPRHLSTITELDSTLFMTPPPLPAEGKRDANRQARRRSIVEVARAVFLRDGFAGTTMSAVAAALGGSKETLWRHFTTKEDLFAAVVEAETAGYSTEMIGLLDGSHGLVTTLEAFCRRFIEIVTSPDVIALHRLIVGETGRFPELGRIFFARGPGMVEQRLIRFMAIHMDSGTLRAGDPAEAAQMLISLCLGGSHQRLLWSGDAVVGDQGVEAGRALALFLRAFAA
ncbi:TetR/AcrR family transcriptional regulator [Sphingomonas sp. MMS24-J13]|uniref:TetR/AcrR family transcriptional regulator n=1 Tax=Sphingomonas sp. MMS24-J13 TaxID=3238686 RepID=UPI00384CDBAC